MAMKAAVERGLGVWGVLSGALMGVFVCVGCTHEPVGPSADAVQDVQEVKPEAGGPGSINPFPNDPSRPPVACPSPDFRLFIDAFADSTEVQRAFTIIPIKFRQKNSEKFEEYKGELQFPVFPDREKRTSWKVDYDVVELSAARAKVSLHLTANTAQDSLFVYHFSKDACWQLESYEQSAQQPAAE
jgi:hypothetical protein